MRIISQNRRIDVSYERSTICVRKDTDGVEITAFSDNRIFALGKYETLEDATLVVEAIRARFAVSMANGIDSLHVYYHMPKKV